MKSAFLLFGSLAIAMGNTHVIYGPGKNNAGLGTPQTTTDTNCIGMYGGSRFTGCQDTSYYVSSVTLESAKGFCNQKPDSKYNNNELTQDVTLRLVISVPENADPAFDVGVFISGNNKVLSTSSTNCQHFYLSPVASILPESDPESGYGPFINLNNNRCGDAYEIEPTEIVVDASLICSKKGQKMFKVGVCLSYDFDSNHQCSGLPDTIPSIDTGSGLWSPCNCTEYEINLAHQFPPLDQKADLTFAEKYGSTNDKYAPANDKYAPANDKYAPANDKYAPANDKYAPANDKYAPANDKYAPGNGQSKSQRRVRINGNTQRKDRVSARGQFKGNGPRSGSRTNQRNTAPYFSN